MKMTKIKAAAAAIAALAMSACTSYEIDMPANPEPTVGPEVSTQVIYEANPRFFAEQNCLNALDAQLTRIADMGCDVLWIMPVFEPGELGSVGSPYCIRDFKALNPRYGTMADLKKLVDDAHGKGVKVILDWVSNHTSWDHPWIKEHPDRYEHDDQNRIVSPAGWADVAQLDYNNPATAAAMREAMMYWVEQTGIDGYRCDYVDGAPMEFWSTTIAELKAAHPDLIMLAETANADYYGCGFSMIYDWNCAGAISGAFNGGKPADVVSEAVTALSNVPAGKSILRFAFNHDTAAESSIDGLFGSVDAIPAAYAAAAMLGGTPMVYSAMDVEGLTGTMSFFGYTPLTFSDALTAKYKAINSAFRQSAEVRRGELADYSADNIVCFTRSIPGHTLLVAVNTANATRAVRTPIMLANSSMTDLLSGETVTVGEQVELAPYAYTILMN